MFYLLAAELQNILNWSSIPTAAGVLIFDRLNSHNLQWFSQRAVIFPTTCWIFCCPPDSSLPSRLLGTQSATQSTGSVVYLVDGIIDSIQQQQVPESLIQLLLPSHRGSNLKSECLSCMYNWNLDINFCIKK